MIINIQSLYYDHNISIAPDGHKHTQEGWINTICPFCTGNPGYHLGYNTHEGYFTCYRCGGKFDDQVIQKLLNIPNYKAKKLLKQYKVSGRIITKESITSVRLKAHKFPSNTLSLQTPHKKYLEGRGFDSDKLEHEWKLIGTGPISSLDGKEYKHRIIAPIYWDGIPVSFQGRDITNRHKLKYKACPEDRELIHHKHILYGKQNKWLDMGICVEGITDVWRLGDRSFGTFGIKYTHQQLRLIAKTFKRVTIIFDDEPQARKQAKKLMNELKFRGVPARIENIIGDPGGLKQDDANHLVSNILKKIY